MNRAPSAHANFAGLGAEGKDGSGPGPGSAVSSTAAPAYLVWLAIMLTGLGTGLVSVVLTNISVGFGNTRFRRRTNFWSSTALSPRGRCG